MDRQRAYALMDELDLDAVVATGCQNLTYLSQVYIYTQRTLPGRMSAIVLTRDGDAIYVFCSIDDYQIRDGTWIRDLRGYREFVEDPMELLASALREKHLEGKRIGLERGALPGAAAATIEGKGPAAVYVDNREYFKRLRMLKTPEEIALLQHAATTTRQAIDAAFAAARPGHTEKQVANDIVRHMFEGGCEETAFLTIATGRNASRAHHMPDATPLRPGEIVRTDLGGCFRGYYSDVGRTHVVGAPSPAQAETYRRLHGVYRGVLELMTVGRPISELYDACRDRSHGAGLPFFMHHIGHGLGVEIHEPPMVEPQERTLLQESMLFNIELYHRDGEGEGYFVEDLVQITAGGPRILTGSLAPAEIPVIA